MELELLIPIAAILVGGLIAVTAIMSKHQRKMAEMMRQNSQQQMPDLVNELQQMRNEMQVMRGEIHQTAIAVDDLKQDALPNERKHELHSRITEEH